MKNKHGHTEIDVMSSQSPIDCPQIRYMELDPNDESQFSVLKDCKKPLWWFLDNAGKVNNADDEDFDAKVY